jgi:hypothetical protein
VRRGGTLQDSDHRLLAIWAADCAQHVLHWFEDVRIDDDRPRRAIDSARAWARGEITMTQARTAAGFANAAARDLSGAAAYAIKAARAAAPKRESEAAGRRECRWQREQLPEAIRDLVLDDQRLRNDICWSAFNC